ncbi:hypothetical protein JMJ77_0002756 [Colletotrichum scovillei]|uniref:Uncharacterized protein n=1 Tax=Colletotrichum scovillei TaxID=1209932 RepID=A0A9P7RA65_9PEZI|nr:hypothetical protein JMJ77_0002756 [Colletotrichum scovillei]KAG7071180.1 hypothetical protein JMJ76_0002417 [Colletotrichum scovillei]KAG7079438.1 hypothetical protein JMJ78_0003091 [Colletotrichum scovillei]
MTCIGWKARLLIRPALPTYVSIPCGAWPRDQGAIFWERSLRLYSLPPPYAKLIIASVMFKSYHASVSQPSKSPRIPPTGMAPNDS